MRETEAERGSTTPAEGADTAELDECAVATACGLLWGFGVFFLAWWVRLFSRDTEAPLGLGRVYRGYRATAIGSVIGGVWGVIDGFVGGWLYAKLYNTARRVFRGRNTLEQSTAKGDD